MAKEHLRAPTAMDAVHPLEARFGVFDPELLKRADRNRLSVAPFLRNVERSYAVFRGLEMIFTMVRANLVIQSEGNDENPTLAPANVEAFLAMGAAAAELMQMDIERLSDQTKSFGECHE